MYRLLYLASSDLPGQESAAKLLKTSYAGCLPLCQWEDKKKSGALKRSWCSTWLFPTPHKWWLLCSLTSAGAQSAHAVRQRSTEWNKRLTGPIETPSLLHSQRTGECHLPCRIPSAPPQAPVGQPGHHVAVTAQMPPQAGPGLAPCSAWLLWQPYPRLVLGLAPWQRPDGMFCGCLLQALVQLGWTRPAAVCRLALLRAPAGVSKEAHNEPIRSLNICNSLTAHIKIVFFSWVVMVLINERESLLCGYKWTKGTVQAHPRLTEIKRKQKTSNVGDSN